MASRFYVRVGGGNYGTDPTVSGAWTSSAGSIILPLEIIRPGGSATNNTQTLAFATATDSTVLYRLVSRPLLAQTISGTFKGQVRMNISNVTGCTCNSFVTATVIDQSGSIVATLVPGTAGTLAVTTTATNRITPISGTAISSYTCNNYDRICIEVGMKRTAGTTSRTGTINLVAAQATDLAEDNTTTTANNSWWEFSGTISLINLSQPLLVGM